MSRRLLGIVPLVLAGVSAALVALVWYGAVEARARPRFVSLPSPERNLSGIAYDGRWLWLTVDGAQVIYQVEPESMRVERKLPFHVRATGGSAWDGAALWQLAYEEKKIYRLDGGTLQVTKVIDSPGEGQCSGLTFDGRHLWAANFEDKKFYQIDQNDGGKILRTLDGYFEATGLAWDGKYLWNGLLVGTLTHDEAAPYTGFVQQRALDSPDVRTVFPIPGVGPGTSNWTPGGPAADTFWWYDGVHNQIVRVELSESLAAKPLTIALAFFVSNLLLAGMAWSRLRRPERLA